MFRHRRALRAALLGGATLAIAGFVAARRDASPDVRLMFTGDILLSRQVAVERLRTGASPWDSLAPLFKRADWVAGNLEGAIGPEASCGSPRRELCFAFGDSATGLLAAAGFDALSIENNHAADAGAESRSSTTHALARAGLIGVDFENSPRFVRVGDLTVAIVAVSTVAAADGRAQGVPSVDVDQRLRLARTLANVVVVSIHWGTELQNWPNASQRAMAEWLVAHGADVVVGHHPHVVQKPDCLHGHPVFYSLGNHVFDQKYPETKDGLIADCVVHAGQLRCGGVKTHARRGSAMPVSSGALDNAELAACNVPVRPSMIVSGWTLRPAPSLPASIDSSGVVLEGWRDGVRRWQTRRVSLVSLDSHLRADGRDRLFALERHASAMDGEFALRPHVYELTDRGLVAKWRGTALAWPLLDAVVDDDGDLCALHRGDSFLRLNPSTTTTRTMRYQWNGFGFSATSDVRGRCAQRFAPKEARSTE